MTKEILQHKEDRKLYNKDIRRRCREAKENYWSSKYEEIEELHEKHNVFNLHKKVKERAVECRRYTAGRNLDEHENILRRRE